MNSFATPDAVTVRSREVVAGRAFTVDLPRHSVSVIVLERILAKMAPAAADGRGVR